MASYRIAKGICDDYLTCSICLSKFTDPRQLKCGHSFCLGCLDQYVTLEMTFLTCPLCRAAMIYPESVNIKAWIKTLPKDNLLNGILMTIERNTESITLKGIRGIDDPLSRASLCANHGLDLVYFCFDHSDNLCETCVSSDHSRCDFTHLLQIDLKITSLSNDMECSIVKRLEELKCAEHRGRQSLVEFKNQKRVALDRIMQLRQSFENFSRAVMADFTKKEQNLNVPEDVITSELTNITSSRNTLENMRSSTFRKEADVVLNAKDIAKQRRDLREFLEQDTSESCYFGHYRAVFKENSRLESMFNEITDIGTLEISRSVHNSNTSGDQNQSDEDYLSLIDSETAVHRYRKIEFLVHEGQCTLSGCCITDTCMILVDQLNNFIIKTDFEGNIVEKFSLQDPHQVCAIDDNRIVVTCWEQMKLFVLDIEPNIALCGIIDTKKQYLGIHSAGNCRLLVTSPNDSSIDVISMVGEVVHSIEPKRTRNILFSLFTGTIFVPFKAIMKDTNVIIYHVKQKCIFCLDLAGNCVWKTQIPGISGFACGQHGIYCTQSISNKVILLSFDGEVIDSSFLKVNHPWSIDVSGSTVLITEDSPSGKCAIFRLNHQINEN